MSVLQATVVVIPMLYVPTQLGQEHVNATQAILEMESLVQVRFMFRIVGSSRMSAFLEHIWIKLIYNYFCNVLQFDLS